MMSIFFAAPTFTLLYTHLFQFWGINMLDWDKLTDFLKWKNLHITPKREGGTTAYSNPPNACFLFLSLL